MKANNLTISIPNKGCNKKCPYCISDMTPSVDSNPEIFLKRLLKAKKLAEHANVSSVLVTGKGEPTLNLDMVSTVGAVFNEFPLEIQTNGVLFLQPSDSTLVKLSNYGFDVISLSFDNWFQFKDHSSTFKKIKELGMTSRVTFNVTDFLPEDFELDSFFYLCREHSVDQFSLRNITYPSASKDNQTLEWIKENTQNHMYEKLLGDFNSSFFATKAILIGSTSFGGKIYDVQGVSFTYFDSCIQENHNEEDIRSLIYQEDGHMYTTWNSKASRVF